MSAERQIIPVSRYGAPLPSNFGSFSGYEGAQYTGVRDGFFFFPLEGKTELNSYTRIEMLRKKRALEANLPIVGRIQSAVGRKSVGRGIMPKPATQDKDWNRENRRQFINRCSNPSVWSVDASMDFFEQQRFLVESRFGDGEGFAIFSKSSTGTLQVDVRDPVECRGDSEEDGFTDGVKTNAAGRPIAYRFEVGGWYGTDAQTIDVPANAVCHLRRIRRARTLRAVTEFYAGINSLIDVLDLKALLVGTAKLHSVLGVKVKKGKGDAGSTGLSGNLQKALGIGSTQSKVSENFAAGAAIAWLAENEDLELVTSDHPGANMLEFWNLLIQDVARGCDVPASVVCGMADMGGTPSNIELEDGQDFFNQEQDRVTWRFCEKAYILDTAIRMDMGLIKPPNDPQWWTCNWRGPAKITANKSKATKSDIDRMHNLMLTWGQYWDELGLDSEDVEDERIEELSRVMDKCEAARKGKGVPFELVFSLPPGTKTANATVVDPKKPTDDDEDNDDEEE